MQIKNLQNKHQNEMIFIVGAGPSINNIDMNLLKDYTVMAVNSGILAVPFADYFISDDPDVMNWSYFNNVKKSDCICLFYKDRWQNCIKGIPENRVAFYTHKSWFSPPSTYNLPEGLILTRDIDKPIIGSRTSTGSCVHLAYCLGAKVMILLGNDCKLSKGKRYFWQGFEQQPYRIGKHIFNKRTQNFGFSKDDFTSYWKHFYKINKAVLGKEVEIIDGSDSTLKWFPKMNIEEILKKYGEKKKVNKKKKD